MRTRLPLVIAITIFAFGCKPSSVNNTASDTVKDIPGTGKDSPAYGGNKAGNRYSSLKQINLSNVSKLEVAWMYKARVPRAAPPAGAPAGGGGGGRGGNGGGGGGEIQCQPIIVDGVLYATTPELDLFALNAATGQELWKFTAPAGGARNRGVMYWQNEAGTDKRILHSVNENLFCLDAKTGKLIESFGNKGVVDLKKGLAQGLTTDLGATRVRATSPGVIYKNTLVIGSAVSEGADGAPGHIQAFNVVTGALEWVFHTIPQPGEFGYDTWPKDAYKQVGGANSWSGMVMDEENGIVFFGTGSPTNDFYGGNRAGKNLFANSIVAVDAKTGKMVWYYQTIAHDLWDRDHPQPPVFTTIKHDGKDLYAVVQATKDGQVYVLNAKTGESVFPVEERAVPTKGLPGETVYPTQKFPLKPKPFSRQLYTENDISNISPQAEKATREIYEKYKTTDKFAPPTMEGTLLFGYSGGAEWGGNAVDQDGILYQPANDNPWILTMQENIQRRGVGEGNLSGVDLYKLNCQACHGADKKGNGSDFPNISNIKEKYTREQLAGILEKGIVRMPSFAHLPVRDRNEILNYVLNENVKVDATADDRSTTGPAAVDKFGFQPAYITKAWTKVFDPDGYPGIKPPWGTLNAIDLNTGDYLWTVPLGEFPELTKKGIPITGTESYGGPIVTAGGLIFIAGTRDEKIRAFDKKTGKVVWEYQLPAGGFATPATYEVNGKQYLVIAAGGARGLKAGDNYIAFKLPD